MARCIFKTTPSSILFSYTKIGKIYPKLFTDYWRLNVPMLSVLFLPNNLIIKMFQSSILCKICFTLTKTCALFIWIVITWYYSNVPEIWVLLLFELDRCSREMHDSCGMYLLTPLDLPIHIYWLILNSPRLPISDQFSPKNLAIDTP